MSEQTYQPSPQLFFETVNAYQRTAALKAAIELDVFSLIARGANTPSSLAKACGIRTRRPRVM